MNFDHIFLQCLTDSPPPRLHVYLLFICLITYWVQLVLPMFVGLGHPQEHGQPNRDLIIKEKLILLRNHQLSIVPHLGWGSSWAPLLSVLQCWLAWSCTGLTQVIPGAVSLPRVQPSCHVQKTMFCSSFPQLLTLPIFWSPPFPCWSPSLRGVACDTDVPSLAEHSTNIYSLQFGQGRTSALAHHTLYRNLMMSFKNCSNLWVERNTFRG